MASIKQHGNNWQVRVRKIGHPTLNRGFTRKSDAIKWARASVISIDQGRFIDRIEANKTTLAQVIQRCIHEVLRPMKGAKKHASRFNAICQRSVCKTAMSRLMASAFTKCRDERLQDISAGVVVRELAYLSSFINLARHDWGFTIHNPISSVREPYDCEAQTSCYATTKPIDWLISLNRLRNATHG